MIYAAILSAGCNGSTETGQSKAKYIISIPPPSPRLPNTYTCCRVGGGGATNRCSDWNTECWSRHVKFEIYPMNNHVLTDYYSAGINSDMFNHTLFTGTIICIVLITVDVLKRENVLTSGSLNWKRGVWTFKSRCSVQQWSLCQTFRRTQFKIVFQLYRPYFTVVFLKRRAAARYRALVSIMPGRERPE